MCLEVFKQSGKAKVWDWWQVKLVNWEGTMPLNIIIMTLAMVKVEEDVNGTKSNVSFTISIKKNKM